MTKILLSGLPRTGSTLFSSILQQNENFHVEKNSALCRIMWDIFNTMNQEYIYNELTLLNKQQFINDAMQQFPKIYYKKNNKKYIVDHNRAWTLPGNFLMAKKFIDEEIKMIIMIRDFEEIVNSYFYILNKNNIEINENLICSLFTPGSNPLMRPLAGVFWSLLNEEKNFIFIDYNDLVFDTENTLKNFYIFFNINTYNHYLNNLKYEEKIFENFFGIHDLHNVRPSIEKRIIDNFIPASIIDYVKYLNTIYYDLKTNKNFSFFSNEALDFYHVNTI